MKSLNSRPPSLRSFACIAMIAIVSSPAIARAQSGQDLQTAIIEDLLKITVTTASRHAEGVGDAPAQVDVITARQIQERGYRSLGELLRDQLGIKVELGTDPDYPSDVTVLGSRGISRVVLLMDGIRVMSPTGEPLPIMANYPIHHARQVEIVYGPASALYGADAFSAVINVIRKDASELDGFGGGVSVGDDGSRRSLPGCAAVNVNLRRNRITRNLDAFVRVENLLDARYFDLNVRAYSNAEKLAGSPQGPRRISIGFDVRVGR